jgi:hypothetical protein
MTTLGTRFDLSHPCRPLRDRQGWGTHALAFLAEPSKQQVLHSASLLQDDIPRKDDISVVESEAMD